MAWNFGVLDKDSGVKKALEEMEADYNRILDAEKDAQPVPEEPELEELEM